LIPDRNTYLGVIERASIDDAYLDLTNMVAEILLQEQETQVSPASSGETGDFGISILYGNGILPYSFTSPLNSLLYLDTNIDKSIDSIADRQLMAASKVMGKIRKAIFEQLGYTCSAGTCLLTFIVSLNSPF